jgi:hypothetical protein
MFVFVTVTYSHCVCVPQCVCATECVCRCMSVFYFFGGVRVCKRECATVCVCVSVSYCE